MVGHPSRLITLCSQRRSRKLERSVVGDIESPIRDQTGCLTSRDVTISDNKQVFNFLFACLVWFYPPGFEPVY